MGKSLRSKSKLKFRTVKRASGVFGKADKERAARLAEKLGTTGTGLLEKKEKVVDGEEDEMKEDGDEDEKEENGEMEVDEGMFYL